MYFRTRTQTPDGWSVSAAEYDNLGRMRKSYNPFYGTTPTSAVPTGTKYTETTVIDAFGRATEVTLQDGTKVYTYPNESTATYTAPNNQSITGIASRVKDQAGKERRQVADALGRLVRVDEPDANGSLGAVDASLPLQQTHYEYDGNDNLSKVIQSDGTTVQERKFKYDSLSRLTHEKQVEANATLDDAGVKQISGGLWTKVLKYDIHGLLTDGYDARGVRTQIGYDGLNRVSSVAYSGETGYQTPAVTYTYDQARTGFFNTGALTKVETAASGDSPSTKTEFDYDKMGRVVKHRQWIGAQEYDLEYGYNLAGQLTSEKYPSGRVVANSYDANGRLSGIADASRTYLSGLVYQGNGNSLSSMTLGNATTQSFTLNDRMQMTEQELKKGSEVLQKYSYGYGQIDGSGNLDAAKNNGQLGSIESFIGTAKQWTQKFSYDPVGRLKQAEELRGDTGALSYRQVFDFDRFGNMYRKAASNATAGQASPLPYTAIEDADISKATNRFATETTYDDAGNVTIDNKFRDMSFGYDANGRMVKAMKAGTPDALSVYDAGGLRVAERVNDVWRFSIFDIGGKCVAEYGGPPSTDDGGVKYVLSDWQGSTRAVINNAGFVNSRSDYTAYGENITSGVGLRTTTQGFGISDDLRNKYALTTRDDATGLDHTPWRKHENQAGRWTSPDPYNGSASAADPQSFNKYSYVQSQPTNFTDPFGLLREATHRPFDWGFWWWNMFGAVQNIEVHGDPATTPGGGGSPIPPSEPDPCVGKKGRLNYDKKGSNGETAREHITKNHISDETKGKSKYRGSGILPESAIFAGVTALNQLTFRFGTYMPSHGKLMYVYAIPEVKTPSILPVEVRVQLHVGTDISRENKYTNVNTLVLSDCNTPTSSYPGKPSNFGNRTPGGGRAVWNSVVPYIGYYFR